MSSLPFRPRKTFKNRHWQDCFVSWLTSVYEDNSHSISSFADCHSTVHRFFTSIDKPPDQVTSDDVRYFINGSCFGRNHGQDPAPGTRNSRLRRLKTFYNYARRYAVVRYGKSQALMQPVNPCDGIKMSSVPPVERDMTEEEFRLLMAQIPRDTLTGKRDRALMLTYLHTGRRNSEIRVLCWGNLKELSDGSWVYSWKGKGRTYQEHEQLPEPAINAIREYLEADGRWDKMQPGEPIFRGTRGNRDENEPMRRSSIAYIFRKYADKAGLPRSLCPHAIRHLFAREYHEACGERLEKTQKRLGHQSPATTILYIECPRAIQRGDKTLLAIQGKYSDL